MFHSAPMYFLGPQESSVVILGRFRSIDLNEQRAKAIALERRSDAMSISAPVPSCMPPSLVLVVGVGGAESFIESD